MREARSAVDPKRGVAIPTELEIVAPDGRRWQVPMERSPLTVGRAAPGNEPDVALGPDPNQWVSRTHCILQVERGIWSVTDTSVNGTGLRRDEQTNPVREMTTLRKGDVICILGGEADGVGTLCWELRVVDPYGTERRGDTGPCLKYKFPEFELYRHHRSAWTKIEGLGGKGHDLVRYMAARNRDNGGVPVTCPHEELIRAVWGEPGAPSRARGINAQNLRDLVFRVREQVEPNVADPQLLLNEPGIGYRLMTCPDADDR